jgi:outer membrane protein assembly factor BamB
MKRQLMKGPWRFLVYLFVIAAFVAGGVFLLLDNQPPANNFAGRGAPSPPPWKRTERAISDANEDFSVERSTEGNAPLAGKGTGTVWPQFNGTRRDNRSDETGLLETWPEGGPPLSWAARGLGNGYSSVAVVDGVVYTLGNKKESEALIALDAGTGEKIWSTPFARASHAAMGEGPRGTPSVSDGYVYGMGAEGELVCLEAKTGEICWQVNILSEYGGRSPGWGICESVLIDGETLICTPGGSQATMLALDKRTGKELWKTAIEREGVSYASPIVVEIDGVRQYVQFLAQGTVSVRADDGQFLWRNTRSSSGTANCSSPLASGDLVFTASNYGTGGALLKLTSTGRNTTADLVYHTSDMKSHHGDMVIVDGLLYGSNDPGILMCLDLETGKVRWQNRSVGKGAVTYADGKIYLRGENSEIALVEATGNEYREQGRFEQPDRSALNAWSHPVVAHGRLFLRDQGLLLCYDLRRDATQPK